VDQCGLHYRLCVELVCQSVFDGSFHIPRESYGEKRRGLRSVPWRQLCVAHFVFEPVFVSWCTTAMGTHTRVLYCGSDKLHIGQNGL